MFKDLQTVCILSATDSYCISDSQYAITAFLGVFKAVLLHHGHYGGFFFVFVFTRWLESIGELGILLF